MKTSISALNELLEDVRTLVRVSRWRTRQHNVNRSLNRTKVTEPMMRQPVGDRVTRSYPEELTS
jgi:hypothetical protein